MKVIEDPGTSTISVISLIMKFLYPHEKGMW